MKQHGEIPLTQTHTQTHTQNEAKPLATLTPGGQNGIGNAPTNLIYWKKINYS